MSNRHYPYKSRKNKKRALGIQQRNVAPTKKEPLPMGQRLSANPFVAAVVKMLASQRGK